MGGGDLNLKKSWHPATYRNQEKVFLREKKASEEKKKIEQLQKELEEQRAIQELQQLHEATGKVKKVQRVEWMYSGPAGVAAVEEDREAYLLGKKRIDKLIEHGQTAEEMSAKNTFSRTDALIYGANANTDRDIANKIREDPLFAIKQREHASLKAILDNPYRRKQIVNAGTAEQDQKKRDKKEKKKEKEKKKKSKKSEKRHREDDVEGFAEDSRRNHNDFDHDSSDDERRRFDTKRPRHDDSHHRRNSREMDDKREHRVEEERRSRRSPSASLSPVRRRPSRSPLLPRHRRSPLQTRRAQRSPSRSPSPPRRRRSRSPARNYRRSPSRSPSPPPKQRGDDYQSRKDDREDRQANAAPSSNGGGSHLDELRAKRLAAMMSTAKGLEQERRSRIARTQQEDAEDEAREAAIRMKRGRDGTVSAGDMGPLRASEMIQRNRAFVQKGDGWK